MTAPRRRSGRLLGVLVAGVQVSSRAAAIVATLIVFIMLAANVVDIASRTVVGQPLPGVYEYTEVALVSVVFLGIPYTMQVGGHVAIDSVTSRLPGRARRAAEATALAVVLPFVVWLTVAGVGTAIDSFVSREVKFGVVEAPIWPARMMIPVGAGLLAAELAIALGGVVRGRQPSRDTDGRSAEFV